MPNSIRPLIDVSAFRRIADSIDTPASGAPRISRGSTITRPPTARESLPIIGGASTPAASRRMVSERMARMRSLAVDPTVLKAVDGGNDSPEAQIKFLKDLLTDEKDAAEFLRDPKKFAQGHGITLDPRIVRTATKAVLAGSRLTPAELEEAGMNSNAELINSLGGRPSGTTANVLAAAAVVAAAAAVVTAVVTLMRYSGRTLEGVINPVAGHTGTVARVATNPALSGLATPANGGLRTGLAGGAFPGGFRIR